MEELSYLCPMLWDSPGVELSSVPMFASYTTAGQSTSGAIDALNKGRPQYFTCQIQGARYTLNRSSTVSGAVHDWWALTEGDGDRWGFVPEVYLWGGPDFMPDPGLPTCSADELARRSPVSAG
jgi:hypothetical protein